MKAPHPYDPNCPHCRPVLLDSSTGRVLPPDDPVMKVVNAIWAKASVATKEAYIRVTVHNSRKPEDLCLVGEFFDEINSHYEKQTGTMVIVGKN